MGNTINYCSAKELFSLIESGKKCQIIDVREQGEYDQACIKDSILVPLSIFVEKYNCIDKDKAAYMLCGVGKRATKAAEFLLDNGYKDVIVLDGGIKAWYEAGYPIEC